MAEKTETTSASGAPIAEETKTTPASEQTIPKHQRHLLFERTLHPYVPRNVNVLHKAELAAAGFNTRLAVALTQRVGTMWTAYTFAVLAIIGLFAILGVLTPVVALLVAWVSQTFIQLVLLPIIMVGQNVLGRKSELQAEEQFNTTEKSYHDIEQIIQHLSAQDDKILQIMQHLSAQSDEIVKQTRMIIHLLQSAGISLEQISEIQQMKIVAVNGNEAGSGNTPASDAKTAWEPLEHDFD